jgi:hypothetical protein
MLLKQTVIIMKVMAFFVTHLIKLDFTAKARSTQRTASCLLAFNTMPFSAPLAKRAVKIVFYPWFVEDPLILIE